MDKRGHARDLFSHELEIRQRPSKLPAPLRMRHGAPVQLAPKVVRPKSSTVSATLSPFPIGPRIFSAGTGISRNSSVEVAVPRIPHFGIRPSTTSNPGISGVTRKAVIFDGPPAGSGVRAITVRTPAIAPFVMYRFRPVSRYTRPSSLGTAWVWTFPASEPASGSVSAKAAMMSPRTRGGNHFSCCAGVPKSNSARIPIE
jgi:hypothetical protein